MHCLALGLSLCYFQRFTFSVFLITRDCWLRYRPHPTLRDCVKCAPVWTARSWSTQVIREGLYRLWLADQYTLTLSHTHSHTHTHTHTLTHTHTHTDTHTHAHNVLVSINAALCWHTHLDFLFSVWSSTAKTWTVPLSLETHKNEESRLKLILQVRDFIHNRTS